METYGTESSTERYGGYTGMEIDRTDMSRGKVGRYNCIETGGTDSNSEKCEGDMYENRWGRY